MFLCNSFPLLKLVGYCFQLDHPDHVIFNLSIELKIYPLFLGKSLHYILAKVSE